jgi:microcompartment protein CcmK/EutM
MDNSQGIRQMKYLLVAAVISIAGIQCSNKVSAADNTIVIDQIGNGNQTTVVQDGSGNSATITAGGTSAVDYNVFSITQQGNNKTASIDLKSGINNTFNIQQDGTGNHTASIQNMIGSGNNVNITQQGAGNHILNVTNPWNATNTGNTVTATQSGGVGADKRFDLYFSGATGAGVTIQQTNPTQPDQGGMNIQCNPCGSGWSYIKF